MTDEQKLSFDFARSVTLQLITISSAIITLGVTFWEKFKPIGTAGDWKWWLTWSWLCLSVSVIGGFWSWLAQTGTLARTSGDQLTIYRANILIPATIQVVAFTVGLLMTARYGGIAVSSAH
jgi:hypothetical protein